LTTTKELEEAADIKPFFDRHRYLASLLGSYHWNITRFDLVAFQYPLFGDYSCDLVVGDSASKAYGFIEFEDATPASIFRRQGEKATPEWATRFERGQSQLIDWFCKLDDMSRTDEFEVRFGGRHIEYFGLLVIGRDEYLDHPREQRRWDWRSRRVLVNGSPIRCQTYDQVFRLLTAKLEARYPLLGEDVARVPLPPQSE
jgi:hypothetical protein